jgi:hypothetical protein
LIQEGVTRRKEEAAVAIEEEENDDDEVDESVRSSKTMGRK